MHRIVEAEAACKVVAIKPVACKNSGGDITAKSALTDNIYLLCPVKFANAFTKFVDRNIDKSLHVASAVFRRCARIEKCDVLISLQTLSILVVPLLYHAVFDVLYNIACHVHGVLCRGIRRSVSKVEFRKFVSFHSGTDSGCNDIDPLVNTVKANDLSTEQTIGVFFKQYLHGHHLAAGIISGMAHGRKNDLVGRKSECLRCFVINAGRGGGHVENLDNRAALTSPVVTVNTADIVSGDSALLIGRTCKGDQRTRIGYKISDLNRITDSINVGNGGFHSVVHHDTALDTEFKTCILCERGFRSNADRHYDHIGVERRRIF